MKTKKRTNYWIISAVIVLSILVMGLTATVYADTISSLKDSAKGGKAVSAALTEPLDFVANPGPSSGDGWNWDGTTLTLDDFKMDLTQYQGQPYTAAINLPAGSEVDVQGDSGIGLVGRQHNGINAAGDLTIKGNKTLLIDAEMGASGIYAEGNIRIGEGKKPQNGIQMTIKTTGLAINAGGTLTVNGSDLLLDIVDTKGVYSGDFNGAIVADGNGVAPDAYAVDIQDSVLAIDNQNDVSNKVSYGIYAGNGSVRMKYANYRQIGDKESPYYGIRACNGSVDIFSTDIEMQIWTYGGKAIDTKLISAESDAGVITISDSQVKGHGDGKGLNAQGNIGIDSNSDVDIAAADNALDTPSDLSIKGSNIRLISTGAYKNAMNVTGAITINASEVFLSGKGERSNGLYTKSTVNISGDSYVDAEGTLAAIQMIADSTNSPITLQDDLVAREGGTLQYVDDGSGEYIHSYSDETLDPSLSNASKQVVISKNGRLIFLKQPQDQIVNYPDGASYEVRMSREDKVASYQWYVRDYVGNVFELEGQSATTPELIIPSTDQRANRLTYYCVVTDTAGNKLVSKEAYLDTKNKYTENKTVLYVGEYAVNPGESLNIAKGTNPKIGSGVISLSSDGTTIVMDNVKLNNKDSMCDVLLAPSKGIRLARNQEKDDRTDVKYKVILKGANEIINSFENDGGNGITMDFMLFGGEKPGQSPTVIIDGESQKGTLRIKGGTEAIRAIANLEINADIIVKPLKEGDTSYLDGMVADVTSTKTHDISIGANHKLDLTTYGAGIDASGSLTVGENTEINIDMTMPKLIGGESAGAQATEKGAVKVGNDKLELKPNTKLNISCVTDPDLMTNIGACYGLWLKGAGLLADSSTVSIDMSAMPYEDPEYAKGLYGISSNSYVNMKDSSLDVRIDGDKWYGTAYGVLAQTNVKMDNCKADISASASREAFGLAANKDQKLTASEINVVTSYVINAENSCSYGILGSNMDLDVSKQGSGIKADTTNANGIAFVANTGDAGSDPKPYDPSYKAKMFKGSYNVVQPQNAVLSIASIPGGIHPYMYVESFYDSKDTSKPAGCVELSGTESIDKANVTLSYTSTKYSAQAKKPGVTVKLNGKTLKQSEDYEATYSDNINAGKATVTVKGIGNYTGSAKAYFTITKANNKAKVKSTRKISYKKLNKKTQKFKIGAKVKEKAALKYKKTSVSKKAKKYIKVSSKGNVTVRKGLAKGKYKVKVKITAAATKNYAKTVTKAKITIVVK